MFPSDKNENEIIKSIEKDQWKSVKNPGAYKAKLRKAAEATMLKDRRMNIRISKRDLESLKAKALEEGMPYQTLVSSLLHKYVTGRLVEKKR